MNQGKGKGPALPPTGDGPKTSSNDKSESSLLSRIAASAEGLTRSAFSSAASEDASKTLASALSTSEKAAPSTHQAGSSSWAENHQPAVASGSQQHRVDNAQSFKTAHQDEHVRQSEAEFSNFLDGIDSFNANDTSDSQGIPIEAKKLDAMWERSQTQDVRSRTVAEQECRDGEEVAVLLSAPSVEQLPDFEQDDADYDWGLSQEQIFRIHEITRELFPNPTTHGQISADNSLNLVPQGDSHTISQLTGDPAGKSMEQWHEQWEGVLTRYADEVWGGLLPLVKQARQEVEEIKETDAQIKPKALRRLEAILGHLR